MSLPLDRRSFFAVALGAGMPLLAAEELWAAEAVHAEPPAEGIAAPAAPLPAVTTEQLAAAEAVLGLSYTDAEREQMLAAINRGLATPPFWQTTPIPNAVPPALHFDPVPAGMKPAGQPVVPRRATAATPVKTPASDTEWAYASALTMARLIRSGVTTSRQLVERSLARYERYNPELLCAVNLTRERALAQADRLDAEAKRGNFRGPLHGVPYAAKDLFAVPGAPTTWGSPLYRDQVIDQPAAVVEALDAAGAVLVAKTTLGEFAQGDVWFGGTTKNPWNTAQGSSGSSAGSASSVAAGLVPFAIGTETLGSIISPSTRCGVSGLRPTFGRVSRHGAMALSWSMDKIGPIGRYAEDLAAVFAAIHGADPRDPSTRQMPFAFEPARGLSGIRIGLHPSLLEPASGATEAQRLASAQRKPVLDALRAAGGVLKPVQWPADLQVPDTRFILSVEAAAAFEEITRDNRDDQMVQQNASAWPTTFRAAHFVDAVQYVQANRARTMLMRRVAAFFADVDVMIVGAGGGNILTVTNLTGHPQLVVPSHAMEQGAPGMVSFVGALYREDLLLRLAHAWQRASDVHRKYPERFA